LYIKKGEEFVPIAVKQLPLQDVKKSFLLVTVGNDAFYPDQSEVEDVTKVFEEFGIESIVVPNDIKCSSFEYNSDFDYLMIITVPPILTHIEREQIEREFLEALKDFDNVKVKVISEDFEVEVKKGVEYKLPPLTQEMVYHIDSTPNEGYPLRILKTYRENCNSKWSSTSDDNSLLEVMNKHQDQRAEILDKAIEVLEKEINE